MILEAKSITKYYGGFCALNDVDIGVDEGKFVSIIGPKGAGKTTLLNVLTGFLTPDAGQVLFKGEDIAGKRPEKLTRLGIARSFQLVNIFPELSVIDTIKTAIISRDGKGMRFYANLIPDFTDLLFVIERGEIIFSGKPEEVAQEKDVLKIIAGTA